MLNKLSTLNELRTLCTGVLIQQLAMLFTPQQEGWFVRPDVVSLPLPPLAPLSQHGRVRLERWTEEGWRETTFVPVASLGFYPLVIAVKSTGRYLSPGIIFLSSCLMNFGFLCWCLVCSGILGKVESFYLLHYLFGMEEWQDGWNGTCLINPHCTNARGWGLQWSVCVCVCVCLSVCVCLLHNFQTHRSMVR